MLLVRFHCQGHDYVTAFKELTHLLFKEEAVLGHKDRLMVLSTEKEDQDI